MAARTVWIALIGLLLPASQLFGENVQIFSLQPAAVQQYGDYGLSMFKKNFKDVQFKIDPDLDHGLGFYVGAEGFLAVPTKDLTEVRVNKESGNQFGAPLCYISLSQRFALLANGKPVEMKRLRPLKWVSTDGIERESAQLLCTLKQLPGGVKQLCIYGSEKEPVVTSKFEAADASATGEFGFTAENIQDGKVRVAITILGKYTAPFEILPAPAKGSPEDTPATTGPSEEVAKKLWSERKARYKRLGNTPAGSTLLQCDIERSGYFGDGKKLPKKPHVLWKFPADSDSLAAIPGEPLVHQGTVYFGDSVGNLHALDPETAKEKWSQDLGRRAIAAAPAALGNQLFVASAGALQCVAAETGQIVWTCELPNSSGETSPLVVGEAVFGSSGDGFVCALKRQNGEILWRKNVMEDAPPPIKGFEKERVLQGNGQICRLVSASSDGTTLYQSVLDQCRVVALDCKTGATKWSYQARGWIVSAPAVSEKYVFLGSEDLCLHCIDRKTGKFVWKIPTGSLVQAAPAVAHGCVYASACNGRVICADPDSGKIIWSHRLDPAFEGTRFTRFAPLVTDEAVYVAEGDGQFCSLDASTGEPLWEFYVTNEAEIGGMALATDGTRFYLATRPNYTGNRKYTVFAVGD